MQLVISSHCSSVIEGATVAKYLKMDMELALNTSDCCSSAGLLKNATIPGNYEETGTINAVLYQNTPNPFSNETVIRYEIPENAGKCQLHILNMTGSLLKTISINAPGIGSTVIHGRELKQGMYLYSLVIDGQIIDTKQMMFTE